MKENISLKWFVIWTVTLKMEFGQNPDDEKIKKVRYKLYLRWFMHDVVLSLAAGRWFFSRYSGILHQWNGPPRYNWNIDVHIAANCIYYILDKDNYKEIHHNLGYYPDMVTVQTLHDNSGFMSDGIGKHYIHM